MQSDPIISIIYFLVALYLFKVWLGDTLFFEKNNTLRKGSFVGVSLPKAPVICISVLGALLLLGLQCLGETHLNIATQQSKIGYFAIFSFVGAAFVEELIFRGYLVVDKSKALLALSIVGFSLIFALAHPLLWDFSIENAFSLDFSLKAIFYTFFIFLNSIFFYILRFNKYNPKRSLLPCFTAHLVYNIAVYIIKISQGYYDISL